jgi:hypothetical protein
MMADVLVSVVLAWLVGITLGGAGFWLMVAWRDHAPQRRHRNGRGKELPRWTPSCWSRP